MTPSLDAARAVADAVLYEGYLLYPYRAGALKNRFRWQFGVLGPPGAQPSAFAEPAGMSMQCLVAPGDFGYGVVDIHLRFLQVQARRVTGVPAVLSCDEAVPREIVLPGVPLCGSTTYRVSVPGGEEVTDVPPDGWILRSRRPLAARVRTVAEPDGDLLRLTVEVENEHPGPVTGKDAALRHSLVATHLLLRTHGATFVSVRTDRPEAARCRQHRCWPVLAGPPDTTGLLLGSPIILDDHPHIAEQSPGDLFDATEIDELLSLRVMTMTEQEKAEARATDPRAAAIVDRCDRMGADDLLALHGVRLPPASPELMVNGVTVAAGTRVRLHPSRRADAQDLFFAGRVARVCAIRSDVDGGVHVAVVLAEDPAADLHDWYGRYLYFAPDEVEPLPDEAEPSGGAGPSR
ncbi:hypothetical protein GCM10010168_56620 [Actinoplanes ianthinogenes]|uniref:Uncharacterized protein n=1 Tax=Actinoplanes ianthinogenes TaxID=122358 RepID=A0ABM7M2Q2_9ACTN|nr:hypothetical protein [Actinoplanes ianthinogenes]BCJ45918.1 hypothetical protein Aiant_65750 [Actinoplanes ianthinogenes]GGR31146.1 hypothetical protein GCM10010168_56620 [Actinoplanes ianthinogenes]